MNRLILSDGNFSAVLDSLNLWPPFSVQLAVFYLLVSVTQRRNHFESIFRITIISTRCALVILMSDNTNKYEGLSSHKRQVSSADKPTEYTSADEMNSLNSRGPEDGEGLGSLSPNMMTIGYSMW